MKDDLGVLVCVDFRMGDVYKEEEEDVDDGVEDAEERNDEDEDEGDKAGEGDDGDGSRVVESLGFDLKDPGRRIAFW